MTIFEKMVLLLIVKTKKVTPQWPKIDPASNPQTRNDEFRGFWWPWHFDSDKNATIDFPTIETL